MRIFAIGDLHLGFMADKPMDIFGGQWENHIENLKENWQSIVKKEDLVLIPGDLSWAMRLEETKKDFEFLESLNGTKVITKGNHEYWWKSISGVREVLPPSVVALQHDFVRFENYVITGTRGWTVPEHENDPRYKEEDKKIYAREVIRVKLALEDAKKHMEEGDKLIFMIHYPPFNQRQEDSEFTKLFEEYEVDKVIFAHLHKTAGRYPLAMRKNGIDYFLTSADLVQMKPVQIY